MGKKAKIFIFVSVVCVIAVAVTFSAFAGGKPKEKGKLSGSIRLLVWQGYDFPRTFGEFAKEHGVTVDATYLNSNEEIFSKLKAGAEYDIISPNQANIEQLMVNDLLQPIDVSKIERYKNIHPEIIKAYKPFLYQGKVWGVPVGFGKDDFVFAADRVGMIDSWWDLLEPEWKGKLMMLDCAMCVVTLGAMATGVEGDPSLLTPEQFEEVKDFLIGLKRNARAIATSFGEVKSAMIAGDVDGWAGGGNIMIAAEAKNEGYNIWGGIPKEGTLIYLDSFCIPKNAPNLEGAYALINQMLSVETQTELAEIFIGSVTVDAPPTFSKDMYNLFPYDDLPKFFSQSTLNGPFPLEAGKYVTYEEWITAWEEIKATK